MVKRCALSAGAVDGLSSKQQRQCTRRNTTATPAATTDTTTAVANEEEDTAATTATVATTPVPVVDAMIAKLNGVVVTSVMDAKTAVLSHHLLADLPTSQPLSMAHNKSESTAGKHAHAFRAPYDQKACMLSLAANHKYECGFNAFKLDWFSSPCSLAPVSKFKIEWLIKHFFSMAFDNLPPIHVALPSGVSPEDGGLVMLSPPEILWAAVLGLRRLIEDAKADDDCVRLCRKAFQSACVCFEVLDNKRDRLFQCHQLRESMTQLGDSVKRSPIQRLYDVIETRNLWGPNMGAAQMAAMWEENIVLSAGSEPMKVGMIDACLTVEKRMLSDEATKREVVAADSEMEVQSFDSIYKLEAIVKRAKTPHAIRWTTAGIIDMVKAGYITAPELALRQFTGRGLPGGKGVVDLLLGKYDLGCALEKWAEKRNLDTHMISKMKNWLCGHYNYRNDMGFPDASTKKVDVDLTWISLLPVSSQCFLRLFEDTTLDPLLHDVNSCASHILPGSLILGSSVPWLCVALAFKEHVIGDR